MTLRVDIVPRGEGRVSKHDLAQVAAWENELFAEDRQILNAYTWENKRGVGFNVQTYLDSELVGFAHVFVRLARRDDDSVLIGCLGAVMTEPTHHGVGIGSATVKKASEIILRNFRADLGVLLCKPALVPFYSSLGWRQMETPVLIDQPQGKIPWPHEAMVVLHDDAEVLPSRLDLCGQPF